MEHANDNLPPARLVNLPSYRLSRTGNRGTAMVLRRLSSEVPQIVWLEEIVQEETPYALPS